MPGQAFIVSERAASLANYPHARKVGGFIYLSGISSRKPDHSWVGVEENPDGSFNLDIKLQTKAVIENIKYILETAGSTLQNLVDITVFLVDMKDYNDMNEIYNQYFTAQEGPTRTTIGVKQLPNPRLLIEIKGVAMA